MAIAAETKALLNQLDLTKARRGAQGFFETELGAEYREQSLELHVDPPRFSAVAVTSHCIGERRIHRQERVFFHPDDFIL